MLGGARPPVGTGLVAVQVGPPVARLALDRSDGAQARGAARVGQLGDLEPAGREVLEHLLGNAVDLGAAALNRTPLNPEAPGQLVASDGLGDRARGLGGGEDRAHVGGAHAAVGAPDEVGDDDVGVQMRIARATARGCTRRRRSLGRRCCGDRRRRAEPGTRCARGSRARQHTRLVGGDHRPAGRRFADGGQHRHRLGGGEGEVEAGVGAPKGRARQRLAVARVAALEERLQVAAPAHRRGPGPRPRGRSSGRGRRRPRRSSRRGRTLPARSSRDWWRPGS